MCLIGTFGDDVDNAIDGIGTIESTRGTTHNLDALNVLDANGKQIEEGGTESIVVGYATIDHDEDIGLLGVDEHIVVGDVGEATHMHVVDTIGLFRNNHARDETEGLFDAGDTVGAHLVASYNSRGEGGGEGVLLGLGGRRDTLVHNEIEEFVHTADAECLNGCHKILEREF